MSWFQSLLGASPVELTFVPFVKASFPDVSSSIEADKCYIDLYLESLRLTRARRLASRFHAVSYSYMKICRDGEESANLAAVSKATNLADLDQGAVDKVITVSKRMIGGAPYRGGTVDLQLGLFSVKTGDLLASTLDYVTKVSTTAGFSFVGAVKPFLPLITEGMGLLAGQTKDTELEVGVDTSISPTRGFVCAVIAKPRGDLDFDKLALDVDHRLLYDGKALDCGYAVYSVRPCATKPDFGEIPELKERYRAVMSAIKMGEQKPAKDALTAFRLTAITSPDLIPADATRLVQLATEKYESAFPPGAPVGATAFTGAFVTSDSLAEIGLYK